VINVRAWTAVTAIFTLIGLVSCTRSREGNTTRSESVAANRSNEGLSFQCPRPNVVSLQEAIDSVQFPLALPAHEFASEVNLQEVCLDPTGRLILSFPLPHPPERPLRGDELLIVEGWWYLGDPLAEYEGRIESYPDLVGMEVSDIKGVPALGDPAHNSEDGLDRAYLTLVLGRGLYKEPTGDGNGVEIELVGGESVEDLMAIAGTLEIATQ
jgi:hypothetical protein